MIWLYVAGGWIIAATIGAALICRAIHNTKALERAGINARFIA